MERLFHETITSWDDWSRVYQSIPAFSALAEEICRRERLPFAPLQNLTPGTNAVFRVGEAVVKVFFPKESGLDPTVDFRSETAVCGFLAEQGVPTPRLLAQGYIDDKYRFYYIVTEFFDGVEAGDWLRGASRERKQAFAGQLREILCKLNVPAEGLLPKVDLKERAIHNFRLDKVSPTLREELRQRAEQIELCKLMLVHGDLTGENLLVDRAGKIVVIDCADACLAPAWYELGPIVFELFRCDPVLLRAFWQGTPEELAEQALDAVSLHDFGADLLRETAAREGRPGFDRLEEVRELLMSRLT